MSWNPLWFLRLHAWMIVGFWLVEEISVVKDRWISVLGLDGEVCGCFSKRRPWSWDPKKSQNCLEIDERVSESSWSAIIFSWKYFIFFCIFYDRSHTGEIILAEAIYRIYSNPYSHYVFLKFPSLIQIPPFFCFRITSKLSTQSSWR